MAVSQASQDFSLARGRGGQDRMADNRNRTSEGRERCRVLGEGQQAPRHQLGVWGAVRELPQWGSGRSPDRPEVFHHFKHPGWPLLTL